MAAAGLRESSSWALRVPALLAIVAATALFAATLTSKGPSGLVSGYPLAWWEQFELIFVVVGAGGLLGGLTSRVRVSTLLWFNVVSASVAGLSLSIAQVVLRDSGHLLGLWTVVGVAIFAGYLAVWFIPCQLAGALVGRALRSLLGTLVSGTRAGS